MSVNYTNQTVSINTTLSFDQMGALQDLLQMAAMEAAEGSGDLSKAVAISRLADSFGIDLDVDTMDPPAAGLDNEGNDQQRDDMPEIAD